MNDSECEWVGHEWGEAGGGLEICVACEAERWAREPHIKVPVALDSIAERRVSPQQPEKNAA